MSVERQEFSIEQKKRFRLDKLLKDKLSPGTYTEVDHIVPAYLGGDNGDGNGEALQKYEHLGKHLKGAITPELELVSRKEWQASQLIIARSTLEDFLLAIILYVKDDIPYIEEQLRERGLLPEDKSG